MASIRPHGNRFRAEVCFNGKRRSKVLPSRREARDWAARAEYELRYSKEIDGKKRLVEAFRRYAREVSPTKRGHRWEVIRLLRFEQYPIARVRMEDLVAQDFAAWRDARLREVSPGTVRREMELFGAVCSIAKREWGWLADNPMDGVKRPAKPRPRDRLPTDDEIERIGAVAGDDLSKATARVFHAFRFALETGMRAGEIVALDWSNVHLSRRFVHLPATKNGDKRDVPLSKEAVRLIEALPRMDPVFGLRSDQMDALWRKSRDAAKVKDLRFHDSRHAATTRLAKKLEVLELAKTIGHRNISELLTYYKADAEEMAGKLD